MRSRGEIIVDFADSVRLIACGTGMTGENLATDVDCYKIRLRKWNRKDIAVVLARLLSPTKNLDDVTVCVYNVTVCVHFNATRLAWTKLR